MSRPALLGIGGHVVGALVEQLGAVPGLAEAVDLHLCPTLPGGRPRAAPDVLARAAVVLAEAGALDPAERALLPPGCALITLPRLEFESLWPLAAEHPPRGALPGVPAAFGDRIALGVLRSPAPPSSRRAAYEAVALNTLVDLDRMHAFVAREMFRREEGCDIHLAGFVLARFRQERLFHSALHPAEPLLAVAMSQLLGHPAIAALGTGSHDARLAAVLPGLTSLFADQQAPVHPAVAAHFGLAWWSPALRYRQGEAERSFDEWLDWHLQPAPSAPATPTVAPGPDLAALRASGALPHMAKLQAAAEVVRAPPFFATTINPDIAPHGAALLHPDSGRYVLPATLIAQLDQAIVLSGSGTVLLQGLALADTLPQPPPPAPASARQASAAQSLLAFGPGWESDPHGMLTLLPRLVTAARLRRQHPELRVLLPQAARAPWLEEMLALLNLSAATDWLAEEAVACTNLVVTGRLGLAEVSPLARSTAQALATLVPMAPPGPRRLYLRSAEFAPRLLNEPLVAATLAARGFTLVDADRTSLADRIALLRHASAVVAPQGGALAECAFCPEGAGVLELLGPADPSPVFWSLASVCGLRYGYVVGEAEGAATPGSPYQVPLPMLEHAASLLPA